MSEKQIREFYDKDFLTIMREIKKKSEVNKTFNLGKKNIIKVALLGTGSLQYFASMLKYGLNMVDVSIEVFIGTYKGAEIDIMDDDSEYYKFEPDITVIFTDYREILQFPDLYMQEEQVWKMVLAVYLKSICVTVTLPICAWLFMPGLILIWWRT